MHFQMIDRTATKNVIRDQLLAMASANNRHLSKSQANNYADKFKKGGFDPQDADEIRRITYPDPTGDHAVIHADQDGICGLCDAAIGKVA